MIPTFIPQTRLTAGQLNALSSALASVSTRVASLEAGGGLGKGQTEPAIRARIRDADGLGLERHQIVKLGSQAYVSDEYLYDRVIDVTKPDDETAGRWGIVYDGIEPEGVGCGSGVTGKGLGYAYVSGIAFTYCNIKDTSHQYAEAADGETMLVSADSGTALILGRETELTGEQWVIVQWPVGGGGGGEARWASISIDEYSFAIAGDEFVLSEAEQSIPTGAPIRWQVDGDGIIYRYGAIVAATNNGTETTYSYVGPAMVSPLALWWDRYRLSTMVHMFVSGEYANATGADILWTLRSVRFKWLGAPHYLVQVIACQGTDATTTQPKINISVGDSNVTTNGVQLVTSAFVGNAANDILIAGYKAEYGEIVKIAVTTAAVGATKAANLTVELLFVSE